MTPCRHQLLRVTASTYNTLLTAFPLVGVEQRRDAPHGHAPVLSLRSRCRDLQVLRTIALGREVLRWNLELFREHHGDRFGPAVRQGQIVDIATDGIRMPFDQEDLARIAFDRAM